MTKFKCIPTDFCSSKDEDFYSSLALAAEDDNASDVSEADVNQMAKSIAVSENLTNLYA